MQEDPRLVHIARIVSSRFMRPPLRVAIIILLLIAAALTIFGEIETKAGHLVSVVHLASEYRTSFAILAFVAFAIYVIYWMGGVDERIEAAESKKSARIEELKQKTADISTAIERNRSELSNDILVMKHQINFTASKDELRVLEGHLNAVSRFLSESSQFQQRLSELEERLRMERGGR